MSITTLLEKWEGAGDMCNFHIRNGRMIFYWPVPGLGRHREKNRATAHVKSSSKIPTDLIGVNNYPVMKTLIHSTRVCFCFLKRHIATHLASPSIKLFLLGVGIALPPTRLEMNKKSHNPQMDSCLRLLCLDSATIRWYKNSAPSVHWFTKSQSFGMLGADLTRFGRI